MADTYAQLLFAQQTFDCDTDDPNKCLQVQNIINALNIYENNDSETFTHFIYEQYQHIHCLNGIIHLKTKHIDKINRVTIKNNKCDPKNCNFLAIRNNSIQTFVQQQFNQIHFIFKHMHQMGWRVETDEKEKDDMSFADKYKLANERSRKYASFFDRINPTKNKFIIEHDSQDLGDRTILDGIYNEISQVPAIDHTLMIRFIHNNEYDTEAVGLDISATHKSDESNIMSSQSISNELARSLQNAIFDGQLSVISFSEGLFFEYNDEHKTAETNEAVIYIKKKYDSFKEEILSYVTMDEYQTVIDKVDAYIQTDRVKAMKSRFKTDLYGYGINPDDPVKRDHIIAASLYCDFSALSTEFSATFRRAHGQTTESIQQRNSNYYFLSRTLREFVEYYGVTGDFYFDAITAEDEAQFIARGKFYCGMSRILCMPSICIKLCGPTSTTLHVEVATNFCKDGGIIIQFDNSKQYGGLREPLLDVSWISRYLEESERLFFSGRARSEGVRVASIRVFKEQKWYNYKSVCKGLYWLGSLVNGARHTGLEIDWNKKDKQVVKQCINVTLGSDNMTNDNMDQFVVHQFQTFVASKKEIRLKLFYLDSKNSYGIYEDMAKIVMLSLKKDNYKSNEMVWKAESDANVPNFQILRMFRNVRNITIYTTSRPKQKYKSYSIGMKSLFNNIELNMNMNHHVKYKIIAERNKSGRSWILDLSASTSQFVPDSIKMKLTFKLNQNGQDIMTFEM